MRFLLSSLMVGLCCTVTAGAGESLNKIERVEYTLKTARSRDPVLGGPRDKVFVSVWILEGVKVVRGGICNPFSKGDDVGRHWQAACRHWQFAYVQPDFDAVKKEEFSLLRTGLIDLAKKTGHPELEKWAPPNNSTTAHAVHALAFPVVDGRLFVRGMDGLYCYDLRQRK